MGGGEQGDYKVPCPPTEDDSDKMLLVDIPVARSRCVGASGDTKRLVVARGLPLSPFVSPFLAFLLGPLNVTHHRELSTVAG